MLNHFYDLLTDVILKHGGTVLKFVGDEVFAVFGAPLAAGRQRAGDARRRHRDPDPRATSSTPSSRASTSRPCSSASA